MTGFTCPRCGASVGADARYCSGCGLDVSGEHGVATARMSAPPSPEPDDELLARLRRATLGHYDIYGELGRGGMATVYLAHDLALDRKVAIKVMAPHLVGGPGMVERFKREARTAASLSHPHIIPIFAVHEIQRLLFFVMKYVEGRSLDTIIRAHGALPIPMIELILQQVGGAIGYAHRRGIIHRDIKPPNIMLDEEGWAVVTDFGIAKVTDARGLTMTGATIGTPAYMSPEQCAAKEITGASDQYSLGIVAYEMLTGQAPFQADSLMALMWQHFHDPPRPIAEQRSECPPSLAAAVMRMLAKDPLQRWPTIEDAITAIGASRAGPDEPIRTAMRDLAREGASGRLSARVHTPASPLPSAGPSPDAPTVPSRPGSPPSRPTADVPVVEPASGEGAVGAVGTAAANATSATRTEPPLGVERTRRAEAPKLGARRAPWLLGGAVVAVLATATLVLLWPDTAGPAPELEPPPAAPVHRLIVGPSPASIEVDATIQLTGVPMDSAGTPLVGRVVEWSAADTVIATVSPNGLVTGRRPGTVSIAAASEGRGGTATVIVTAVAMAVASVVLEPTTLTLALGDTTQLQVRPRDRDGNTLAGRPVTWETSDAAVVSLTPSGRAVARGLGTAALTAVVEGQRGIAQITVAPPRVAGVLVAPATVSLEPGGRAVLRADVRDARGRPLSGRDVSWSSSDTAVASVSPEGTVVARRPGSATIRATSEGTMGNARVAVSPPAPLPIASIAIEPAAPSVVVGNSIVLDATARDAEGRALANRALAWQSSAPAIASISSEGIVRGVAPGTTRITAMAEGRTASVTVTVEAPAPAPAPPTVEPPARAVSAWRLGTLTAGSSHTCALREDGSVACWGSNTAGQLGGVAEGQAPRPISPAITTEFTRLVAGAAHTCALGRAGTVSCWGANRRGQLGSGPVGDRVTAPVSVSGERRYRALAAGAAHTCAIAADGAALCWGDNGSGQLGNGSTRAAPTPTSVRGGLTYRGLAAGEKHTCAATDGGKAYCWGDGFSGQLGHGIREQRTEPYPVRLDAAVTAIAAGRRHACALAQDGTLYCWGANDAGEIGDGSRSERALPVRVASGVPFSAVAAGGAFTCALTPSGEAYCWGRNREGQLGDGARADRSTPGRVSQTEPFESLVAGEAHVCALTRGRRLYCWGANASGQLGDGTLEVRAIPVAVVEEDLQRR